MRKRLLLSLKKIGLRLALLIAMLVMAVTVWGATYYSRVSGNWNSNTTWSLTSGGIAVGAGIYPATGDIVYIEGGDNVTVNINNAACASAQIGSTSSGGGNGTLTFNSGSILDVSGSVTLGNSNNNRGSGSIDMTNGGLLKVGNAITAPRLGSFTSGAGTIEYDRAGNQTIYATNYFNLTLSGSGAKSILNGTSVSGALSIAPTGSATASIAAGRNILVGGLLLGGVNQVCGTWGSTSSTASYKNSTFFVATTGFVTVGTVSALYNVTGGGGPTCTIGSGYAVGLSSSEKEVNYQLYLNGDPIDLPIAGTGSAISFGQQTSIGAYTVAATRANGLCSTNMSGNATVSLYQTAPDYTGTVTNTSCPTSSDGAISLSNSPNALNFNGSSQSVNLGTTFLSGLSAFTIEGWIKATSNSRNSLLGRIMPLSLDLHLMVE